MDVRVGLLVVLLVVPAAGAQDLRLEAIDPAPRELVPDEEALFPFRVIVDCVRVLQAAATGASTAVNVTADVPPGWAPAATQVVFGPSADCAAGPLAQEASLALRPSPAARGLEPRRIELTAAGFGTNTTMTYPEPVWVAYRASHRLTTNVTFPVTTAQPLVFDLVVEFTANAASMIMFENIDGGGGTLTGLGGPAAYYAPGAGPSVFALRWDPPPGMWQHANVSFTHYVHCADGDCENPRMQEAWRVQAHVDLPATKASPWAGAWVALAAAACLARRRV